MVGDFKESASDDYIDSFLEQCYTIKPTVMLLNSHELDHILLENINRLIGPKPEDNADVAFKKACLAGAVYGVLFEWVRRDMTDSPKEVSRILKIPKELMNEYLKLCFNC